MAPPENGGPPTHDGADGGTLRSASATAGQGPPSPPGRSSTTADAGGYVVVRQRKARPAASSSPQRPPVKHPAPSARRNGPSTPRGRPKYSPLDRSIFQLVECLRKAASPADTAAVMGRVQRNLRTLDEESHMTFDRVFDADSPEDLAALQSLLYQWLIQDRIKLADFKLRLHAFRVLNADPPEATPPNASWKAALLASPPQEDGTQHGAAGLDTDMDVDDSSPVPDPTSVVCGAISDALEQRYVRGVLVAQLEGNMRLHPDSSFQAKLRQLTDISPEIAATHRDFKRHLLNATYDPPSNRLIFALRTRDDAERWAGSLISVQGRLLTLCLPSHGESTSQATLDLDVYKLRAYNLGGDLTKLDVWHLFHGLLGFSVVHLDVARPDNAADADPQLWDVHIRHAGCPTMLRGKTRVQWGSDVIWLHHTAFSVTPPCTRCASPAHPRRACAGSPSRPEWSMNVTGPKLVVTDLQCDTGSPTPAQLEDLAQAEERRLIECSFMAGEDRPAPAVSSPPKPGPIVYTTPSAVVKRHRFDDLRRRCQALALPERLLLWRHLATTDPEWLAAQEQCRLPPPQPHAELTFLQLLRKTTMWRPQQAQRFHSSLSETLQNYQPTHSTRDLASARDHEQVVSPIFDLDDASSASDSDVTVDSVDDDEQPLGAPSPDSGAEPREETSTPDAPAGLSEQDTVMTDGACESAQLDCSADTTRTVGSARRRRSRPRGRSRPTLPAAQVGKAPTVSTPCAEAQRATRPSAKFESTPKDLPRLLRENPATGDVEQVPTKVTQLTVSRFFAPRKGLVPRARGTKTTTSAGSRAPRTSTSTSDRVLSKDLSSWTRIKTELGVTEVFTPANGSCYYYAIGAAKINVCPAHFTTGDRKMRREGSYYRREINHAILARLPDLVSTGTFDRDQLCRRFLTAGQPQTALFDIMERHFHAAALVSCVEVCSNRYWAHEEELLGTAFWFGEPLFVFEVCPDDRVLLQVFRGDNGRRGARGDYWPVERGVQTLRELLSARVLPLMLVYYPAGTCERPSGHFNVLRLPLQRYLEWAGTAGRRARMAKRRTACLTRLGMLPSPSDVADAASEGALVSSGSEYVPSREVQSPVVDTTGDADVTPTASSEQTPAAPASPVTPSSPAASQDVPVLLLRLQSRKPLPPTLEHSYKKVCHANKLAYHRWRAAAHGLAPEVAAQLRSTPTPDAACSFLRTRATEVVQLAQALPFGLVMLTQLDAATLLSLGRSLVCDVRVLGLQAYAALPTTPRRRVTAVSAWVTASEALSQLDARWNMLHDPTRWRRLLPAQLRALRAPAGLSDTDLSRLLLGLTVLWPELDPRATSRSPAAQAATILAWLDVPSRADEVATAADRLAVGDWFPLYSLRDLIRRDPIGDWMETSQDGRAPSLRC